jgi:hypothetical protein
MMAGKYKGEIRPTDTKSEAKILSMSGGPMINHHSEGSEDPRAAQHEKAIRSRLGGHSNFGADR